MIRIIITLFLAAVYISPIASQDFDKSKMDELFTILEKHEQSMGGFSIYQDGKEVYSNAIGFIDLDSKIAPDRNTSYRIGSISKTFTACIIMKLIEQKKVKLSTPLTRFFPKIKNSSRITIENLLNHSSGIYNFTNSDEYLGYMEKKLTRDELYQKIESFGSAFEPGEEVGYSNSNYVLLSMIAEKVTKKSYGELLDDMICKPLGLQRTYYGDKITTSNNEAKSFKKIKQWEDATETDMSIPLGAGAIVSTASDINKFMYSFFNNQVVSQSSKDKMIKLKQGFGYGIVTFQMGNKSALGHSGVIDGFASMAYHFPDNNMTITYLSNGSVYSVDNVLDDALGIYFNEGRKLPEFLPVMKLNSSDLDVYLGEYKSGEVPIDLKISKEGNQLIGQATGQKAFPLDAMDVNKFKFDPAKIQIEFIPKEHRLILTQNGKNYDMKKK